ncbi:MAG: hypothetical protein K6E83_02930 [Clostridium sp.]|nr:hypothetical protein [Clostridium sp.]
MMYRLPEMRDEDILREYIREHFDNGETTVSASEELAATDYAAWVQMILRNAATGNGEWGKSLHYLCFDGDRLVGLLGIRYSMPERLTDIYGDIGYGVRPSSGVLRITCRRRRSSGKTGESCSGKTIITKQAE